MLERKQALDRICAAEQSWEQQFNASCTSGEGKLHLRGREAAQAGKPDHKVFEFCKAPVESKIAACCVTRIDSDTTGGDDDKHDMNWKSSAVDLGETCLGK
ncbi:MAG: hypothetical protein FRX49_07955 [Trebouxia sp. A1-2]|nr:MAG: hypothetical protein FRX49_07955 [Trebouxia sp. A1-2]